MKEKKHSHLSFYYENFAKTEQKILHYQSNFFSNKLKRVKLILEIFVGSKNGNSVVLPFMRKRSSTIDCWHLMRTRWRTLVTFNWPLEDVQGLIVLFQFHIIIMIVNEIVTGIIALLSELAPPAGEVLRSSNAWVEFGVAIDKVSTSALSVVGIVMVPLEIVAEQKDIFYLKSLIKPKSTCY